MSIGSLIGIAAANYFLPDGDAVTLSMVGATIGNVFQSGGNKAIKLLKKVTGNLFINKDNMVTVFKSDTNPIYQKIQKYIVNKHLAIMNKCLLEPYNGEVIFTIKDSRFKKPIEDKFKGHKIRMSVDCNKTKTSKEDDDSDDNKHQNKDADKIMLSSKTASVGVIKEFIEFICHSATNYTYQNIDYIFFT